MGTRTEPGVFPGHSFPHCPNPSLSQTPGSSSLATPSMLSVCPALAGEVTTLQTLDRERQSSYQLLVQVQDAGSPPRSTTGTVHIAVLDLNDNSPTFLQAAGAAGGGLPIQVSDAGTLPGRSKSVWVSARWR